VADLNDALAGDVRAAYDSSARAWAEGPGPYYQRLADAMIAAIPSGIAGASVLDVGAGTGVVSAAALAGGAARVVAIDCAVAMMQFDASTRPLATVGDALRLPFAAGAFDVVAAACLLNHLPNAGSALGEMGRVAGDGLVVTSTFAPSAAHSAKDRIDTTLAEFGYVEPEWHRAMKEEREPRTATRVGLLDAARVGGLDGEVIEVSVDAGLCDAHEFARLRLGMASIAPFVQSLDTPTRARLYDAVVAAIGDEPEPFVSRLLVLVAQVRHAPPNAIC
jgi:ubiquinone/menaquinone biosynthesis C-methylase UbiE